MLIEFLEINPKETHMKLLVVLSLILGFQAVHAKEAATTQDCTKYEKFSDVPTMEMQKIVKAGAATIIDANSIDSFKKSRIPGAKHFATNRTNLAKILPKDKNAPVIAYCGGKSCTAWQSAAKMACEMGYKNIRHFSEGIRGWNKTKKS